MGTTIKKPFIYPEIFRSDSDALSEPQRRRIATRLSAIEHQLLRLIGEVQSLQESVDSDFSWPPTLKWFESNALPNYASDVKLFTPGGSVRGLKSKIKEALGARGEPMTSEELAQSLYSHDPKVSFDLFKRRVIVTASAMHKAKPPVLLSVDKEGGRGKHWVLNKAVLGTPENAAGEPPSGGPPEDGNDLESG